MPQHQGKSELHRTQVALDLSRPGQEVQKKSQQMEEEKEPEGLQHASKSRGLGSPGKDQALSP